MRLPTQLAPHASCSSPTAPPPLLPAAPLPLLPFTPSTHLPPPPRQANYKYFDAVKLWAGRGLPSAAAGGAGGARNRMVTFELKDGMVCDCGQAELDISVLGGVRQHRDDPSIVEVLARWLVRASDPVVNAAEGAPPPPANLLYRITQLPGGEWMSEWAGAASIRAKCRVLQSAPGADTLRHCERAKRAKEEHIAFFYDSTITYDPEAG